MAATIIHDSSEALELCCSRRLFLKPISKLAITVTWADLLEPAKAVSNWEVMARLKQMVHPLQFTSIRVSKSTLDFVRFEAELETKALGKVLCQKLNGQTLDGMAGDRAFQVLASECSTDFPTRKEWESFFQDEEEWPDTLHLDGLPCKWFSTSESRCQKPREEIVREVFEHFGPIRNMDIPTLDVYREETGSKLSNAFSVSGLQTFDVYLQFQQREDLRNAMESLRGMRLMLKESDGKALVCNVKVSLDLTSHLSEAAVQKRQMERRQLEALEEKRQREKRYEREEEADRKRREDQRLKRHQDKLRRRAERRKEESERRALQTQAHVQSQEEKEEQLWEERKFVLVQRRLQSIRLLSALLHRAQRGLAKVQYARKVIKKEEKSSCIPPVSSYEGSRDVKVEPGQDLSAESKKPVVCSPDTIIPVPSRERTTGDEHAPSQEHSRPSGPYSPLRITISQSHTQRDLTENTWPPTNQRHHSCSLIAGGEFSSGKHWFAVHSKKEKVYESEEFLNYILNHYPHTSYLGPYENFHPPCNESMWRRRVSDDGKSFLISLRNLDRGVCTEVSISQNSDKSNPSDEDRYKWKITIKETEPAQKMLGPHRGLMGGYSREFEVSWNKSSSQHTKHTSHNQKDDRDDHPKRGTVVLKDEFPKKNESVCRPASAYFKECLSENKCRESKKLSAEDADGKIQNRKYAECEKRMDSGGACTIGNEKDEVLEKKVAVMESERWWECPQPEEKLRKKAKKMKKDYSGQADEAEDTKKRKKKKKEKHRDVEPENDKVDVAGETRTWKKSCKAPPGAKSDPARRSRSHERLDASCGNKAAADNFGYYGKCMDARTTFTFENELANWRYDDEDQLCWVRSSSSHLGNKM
ncbi:A-kinase anchor protein 17B-like [Brienomyrus brachyistius]|uniref:A-kinase anchor protein 17B-like n=1 Tax=Brienomyrus brachyistius TaxID=42636 RepID=UPI0020B1D206|nr:A-kinase anchor protein 17B-like [Brienomyrus brachyistius]XP_048883918.1 A-kinase anchor protein 17B-like [Brienomyrus brachyistius]XP_048883919.1 A-kinase anchor protein 17B-like [Brienomyrus brachyistius]